MSISNNKATYLVTGGAGFMGSSFIRCLLSDPTFSGRVVNLDALTYAASKENLCAIETDSRYTFVKGDIADRQCLDQIHRQFPIDIIVHFAAETHVDRSIDTPSLFFATNVMGTLNLLEFVRANPNIHFHLISTDEVYGALGQDGVFTEESPYAPNSPYSASKASSDHMARAFAKTYGLNITISHSCNNYGPGQYPEKLIPLMIDNALVRKPLPIYGEGDQVREWLFVDDHSHAIQTILEKGTPGEVYNIGGVDALTNLHVVELLIETLAPHIKCSVAELKGLIAFVKDRPGHDFRYALDPQKILALGFRPQVPFSEGLEKTISSHLDRKNHTIGV